MDNMRRQTCYPEVTNFRNWVHKESRLGFVFSSEGLNFSDPGQRGEFLPLSSLVSYFEGPNLKLLLSTVTSSGTANNEDFVRQSYPRCFAILLYIGAGEHIDTFTKHWNLEDNKLPFTSKSPPPGFPDWLYDEFKAAQWRFCPLELRKFHTMPINPNQILPFENIKTIKNRGSTFIRKFELAEEFDFLDRNTASPNHRRNYVVKTLDPNDTPSMKLFENEVNGFSKIPKKASDHIIVYYCSFIQNGIPSMVLEYADGGSLKQLYQDHMSGLDTIEQQIQLCKQISCLFAALEVIHRGNTMEGYHQDIKPSNILVCNYDKQHPYNCVLKIGDLGLSHFNLRPGENELPGGRDNYGTKVYGAPECSRPSGYAYGIPIKITSKADVFSLSALSSEFATWASLGWGGLIEYERKRKNDQKKRSIANDLQTGGFHDGNEVLTSVRTQHYELETKGNAFIASFLKMISQGLQAPDERPTAMDLCRYIENVISKHEKELEPQSTGYSSTAPSSIYPSEQGPSNNQPENPLGLSYGQNSLNANMDRGSHFIQPSHSRAYTMPSSYVRNENTQRMTPPQTPQAQQFTTEGVGYMSPIPINSFDTSGNYANHHLTTRVDDQRIQQYSNYRHPENHTYVHTPYQQSNRHPRAQASNMVENSFYDSRNHEFEQSSDRNLIPQDIIRQTSTHLNPAYQSPQEGLDKGKGRDTTELSPPLDPPQLSTGHRPATNNPPPLMFEELDTWIRRARISLRTRFGNRIGWRRNITELPQAHLLQDLENRDYIIMVDNSTPMVNYQEKAAKMVWRLVWVLREFDPDGIELYFTQGGQLKGLKDGDEARTYVGKEQFRGDCNMRNRLEPILTTYQNELQGERNINSFTPNRRPSKKRRKLTVYILTTGVWATPCDLRPCISNLVDLLEDMAASGDQVAIQFIRFGEHEGGNRVLKYYDDDLRLKRDLVDTVDFASQDVWKMFCGAQNKCLDKKKQIPVR